MYYAVPVALVRTVLSFFKWEERVLDAQGLASELVDCRNEHESGTIVNDEIRSRSSVLVHLCVHADVVAPAVHTNVRLEPLSCVAKSTKFTLYGVVRRFAASGFFLLGIERVVDAQDVGRESVNPRDDREVLVHAYSVLDERSAILVDIGVRDNKSSSLSVNGYVGYDLRRTVARGPY